LGEVFKPDNNKQDFNYGTEKQDFFDLIKNIGSDMEKLANAVFYTVGNNDKAKSGNSKSSLKKMEKQFIATSQQNSVT